MMGTVVFTGSRLGMAEEQRKAVARLLVELKPVTVHHGDCVGSDSEFATICAALEPRPWVVAHPGDWGIEGKVNHLRAFNPHSDEVRAAKEFLSRNRVMVGMLRRAGDVLIAAPETMKLKSYGGTSYTIRYAIQGTKRVLIVWRDGTITEENG